MSYNPLTTELLKFALDLHRMHEEVIRAAFAVAAGSKVDASVARGIVANIERELRNIEGHPGFQQMLKTLDFEGKD